MRASIVVKRSMSAENAIASRTAAGTIFGLTIERFGIIPAVIVLTLISALAGDKLRPIQAVLLAIALAVCSMLIFQVGLKLPVKAFGWPF